ncbi:unnamed protein product [Macrosiphum euphorbiae]|uniref:Putative nuclease HARBI1 n=1 Tax=Macrosiphum euphorbiae TaxID=13131 RepID=A0AAV0WQJ8_9HEMI|nr:unnamed protein product [Macrosiphum euphorbiae]
MSDSSEIRTSDSDDEFIMDMLYHLPRPRLFRGRSNPLEEFDEFDFKCRFRLSKESFGVLMHLIVQDVKHETKRNVALSPEVQVLITLRYYATGTFQAVIGDHIRVNKSTVCRTIKRVSTAIARLYPQFINMPRTAHERSIVQTGFYKTRNFPRVIGAIDCTHIRIQSPNSDIGERFRNRKGYFSFNVQVICNSNMEIMNIVSRWPGSVHDSTIFDNSLVRAKFENHEYGNNVFLIGDGGYPCRNYLMTPLLNTSTQAEENYQRAHIATRNVIERVFGVWKRRFPVLAVRILTQLSTSMKTIVATAVLYNMLLQQRDEMPHNEEPIRPEFLHEFNANPIRQTGNLVRHTLLERLAILLA